MAIRYFFRLLLVSFVLFAPARASAQSAPDYVFKARLLEDPSDVNAIQTHINASSWSWSNTYGGSTWTVEKTLSGSSGGNSFSSTTSATVDHTPAAPTTSHDTEQRIYMYVRNPGSYNVNVSNNIHVQVNATLPSTGQSSFSDIP